MIFEKYFKGDSLELNMDYVSTINELMELKNCQQSEKWHKEGDAWTHTLNCIHVAYKLIEKFPYWNTVMTDDDRRIAIMSVLFHDIGKIKTTEFKNNDWHSYGHDIIGEKLARRILWNEDFKARENVCAAIRYHMERCGYPKKKFSVQRILQLSYDVNISLLLFVMHCDILGSIPEDKTSINRDIALIEAIKKVATDNHCYNTPYDIYNSYGNSKDFIFNGKINDDTYIGPQKPLLLVMIGLSGAGKDTFIESFLNDERNQVIICRDNIRARLGMCKFGEKMVGTKEQEEKVTEIFNKMFKQAINEGKDIVINNLNLKKKYREEYKKLLGNNDYYVFYYYIEAPSLEENSKRHDGQLSIETLKGMIDNFDMPRNDEYDQMFIHFSTEDNKEAKRYTY